MEGLIPILILIGIVVRIANKVSKDLEAENKKSAAKGGAGVGSGHHYNYNYERLKRNPQERREDNPNQAPHTVSEFEQQPIRPTVHVMDYDTNCEVHKRQESSEGSSIHAHVYDENDIDCEAHTEVESSEGESKADRMERLRRKKEEMDRRLAFDARYDEPMNVHHNETADLDCISSELKLDRKSILSGILYSEILGKPKCKQR